MGTALLGMLVVAGALATGCSGADGDSGHTTTSAASTASDPLSDETLGGTESALGSRARQPIMIRNFGLEMTLPPSWDGRMFTLKPGDLPVVHVASFALPADDEELDVGKAASRRMGADDVRIVLMELPGAQVGTQGFTPTRLPLTLDRSDVRPSPVLPADHALARRRFAVHGRPFSLQVEFGTRRLTARQLGDANLVVRSLSVDPRPELDPMQWRPLLRRPLELPRVGANAACPRSSGTRSLPIAHPLGRGPVYPGIGSPDGLANLKDDLVHNGWYLHKTLWAIHPDYRGPVVIRGDRVDRPGRLRFNRRLARDFRHHKLPSNERSGWRYAPSHTALRGPGCYAFQIDGSGFSYVVVFEATAGS